MIQAGLRALLAAERVLEDPRTVEDRPQPVDVQPRGLEAAAGHGPASLRVFIRLVVPPHDSNVGRLQPSRRFLSVFIGVRLWLMISPNLPISTT